MGPAEIAGRALAFTRARRWRKQLGAPPDTGTWRTPRTFPATLPANTFSAASPTAVASLLATADRVMDGHAEFFGVHRADMVDPDWALDPKTGRRASLEAYAFDIPYRAEATIGDIKQIWEPSRHHHLTVLAAAYAVTGDDRYARRVAAHLRSWWAANPPMRGVHWISGIELGIRLVSWVWVRRLLDGWPGAADLFENNDAAVQQIQEHQRWLAAFPSRGSSANNHAVAELAGRVAAASAFPWFAESARWRRRSVRALDAALVQNTFPSGLNRELATEYHGLVMELGLAAAVEADAAGVSVPASTWQALARMSDALAAVFDTQLRPPRQGDADDGRGLVLDGDATDRWASLLATSDALFGRLPWWPKVGADDARTAALVAMSEPHPPTMVRPDVRPSELADAGLTILRAGTDRDEIWCRCDGGPHGFLSIAAHAHADALSVEVRHGGIDILADPGTYCYHGEQTWRNYFRSTLGHNTLELDGTDQSRSGGPFLWVRPARSKVLVSHHDPDGVSTWRGEHAGYGRAAVHLRSVQLDARTRALSIVDDVVAVRPHPCRLAFHFGPAVAVELEGDAAELRWTVDGAERTALLSLPGQLEWSMHGGSVDPPLGWYSPGFGRKEPTAALIGRGWIGAGRGGPLRTFLTFHDVPRA